MHHRTTATVTALVLCACLLLTGCSARARQRDLIRNDPMYSATWDGIEFLGTEDSKDDGPKPPPVATTRCFSITIPPRRCTAKSHGNRRTKRLDRRQVIQIITNSNSR